LFQQFISGGKEDPSGRKLKRGSEEELKDVLDGSPKKWKGVRFRRWTPQFQPPAKYKKPSDKELTEVSLASEILLL